MTDPMPEPEPFDEDAPIPPEPEDGTVFPGTVEPKEG